MWRVAIQYHPSHDLGWVPDRWTCQNRTELFVLQCTVTKLSVNESFPPKTFQLDFPPGTLLFDEALHAQLLIAAKGTRTPAPIRFRALGVLQRALDVCPNVLTNAQPFADAIDFVTQDPKVPVEVDKTAFRLAGIDPNFEVHCDIEGLTAMELIRWMAAQCPQPIALVERDGKLILKPLIGAKVTSPDTSPRLPLKNAP